MRHILIVGMLAGQLTRSYLADTRGFEIWSHQEARSSRHKLQSPVGLEVQLFSTACEIRFRGSKNRRGVRRCLHR